MSQLFSRIGTQRVKKFHQCFILTFHFPSSKCFNLFLNSIKMLSFSMMGAQKKNINNKRKQLQITSNSSRNNQRLSLHVVSGFPISRRIISMKSQVHRQAGDACPQSRFCHTNGQAASEKRQCDRYGQLGNHVQ